MLAGPPGIDVEVTDETVPARSHAPLVEAWTGPRRRGMAGVLGEPLGTAGRRVRHPGGTRPLGGSEVE